MKFISTFLVCLVAPFCLFGQGYVLTQYFDGADTSATNSIIIVMDTSASNIWQIGPPQKTIFNKPSTVPNAIMTDTIHPYPTNNHSSFMYTLPPTTFLGNSVLALQWMQKLDMDQGFDGGILEFSVDSGITWQNAFDNPYVYNFYGFQKENKDTLPGGEYVFSGTDTTWRNIWLCFETSWMTQQTDSLKVRFTFTSDSIEQNREGWMIDNLISSITLFHTVNEKKPEQYMRISPSPTTGRIFIDVEKLDEFHIIEQIELISLNGQVVQTWGPAPIKFYVDINSHPNGVYFLKVRTNKKTELYKVVLQHE
ncbi:MAG: T9SS type A sorting domain-containing protein [Flavobacteriales bacterium]|nr:T9SS type A sorting domain-containing protein [Flavobacteriales bacterium]MCB9449065.1 T9SS type A sorting domain-containing protein [Flavobacteriales bacterium]